MEGYGYSYPTAYPQQNTKKEYPDHGDGFRDYYGAGADEVSIRSTCFCGRWHYIDYYYGSGEHGEWPMYPCPFNPRPSCSKDRNQKRGRSRSLESDTKSRAKGRSRSLSKSRSRSKSLTRSKSRSKSRSRTHSLTNTVSRCASYDLGRVLARKEPGLLDAFRIMYLTPSVYKKSTTMYLSTKKRQDRITEILKSDGFGSKRWFLYPRSQVQNTSVASDVPGSRDNCDQRVKVDGVFFRKLKKNKYVDKNSPITQLKRWELILYEKLGFIQSV